MTQLGYLRFVSVTVSVPENGLLGGGRPGTQNAMTQSIVSDTPGKTVPGPDLVTAFAAVLLDP